MFLAIENVGKLEAANIELNAITVIAGENNSGKSTVGKVLFCIFNSLYNISEQIGDEILALISGEIEAAFRSMSANLYARFDGKKLAQSFVENKAGYLNDKKLLRQDLANLLDRNYPISRENMTAAKLTAATEKIFHYLDVSDSEILAVILRNRMRAEFNMQINNLYHPEKDSKIVLAIGETEITIQIKNNEHIDIVNHVSLDTEVIYIDDPYAVDNLHYRFTESIRDLTHREHLRSHLANFKASISVKEVLDEIIASKKLKNIFVKINSVCPGAMTTKTSRPPHPLVYEVDNSNAAIDLINVSTGLKAFIVIKTLLLNGCLKENGVIILDEPEKHLHPEWQLIFAEIVVLIQKEFNMHILINTHSPYFLDAVETYSRKHGIAKKCKYYLAEDVGTTSIIYDVSGNTEKIYQKLAKPLQDLENERYADD